MRFLSAFTSRVKNVAVGMIGLVILNLAGCCIFLNHYMCTVLVLKGWLEINLLLLQFVIDLGLY